MKFYWLQTPVDPRYPNLITIFYSSRWDGEMYKSTRFVKESNKLYSIEKDK